MAKKKTGKNKSLEIRNYLEENPSAKPKDVAAAMKSKGITVTPQFVSTVKSNSKRKRKTTKRRGRPAGSTAKTTVARKSRSADKVSVDSLLKLKEVVKEIGSIEEAKSALSTLERLSD